MIFDNISNRIKDSCERNGVSKLFAFGSAVTNSLKDDSDIDFIVEIAEKDPIKYADHYFHLKDELLKIFSRNIDLLEENKISNPYLKSKIEKTKKLLFCL